MRIKLLQTLFGLGLKEAKYAEESFQLTVYSNLQNLFPQDKSECVLISKEEYNLLTKYKGLYLDIIGTLNNVVKQFSNS